MTFPNCPARFIATVFFTVLLLWARSAAAQPRIEWAVDGGPFTSGPTFVQTHSGGGRLVEFDAAGNAFGLSATETPVTIRLRIQLSGSAIAPSGASPWAMTRLILEGKVWMKQGLDALMPGLTEGATLVWEYSEEIAPTEPDVWFGGSVGPVEISLQIEPGTTWSIAIWNSTRLNMFDLGYHDSMMMGWLDGFEPNGQIPAWFGPSWDGPAGKLQAVLDAEYGPGVIDARTDYVGFDGTEIDPGFWSALGNHALVVREIAGCSGPDGFGWYAETGALPPIDGVDDGVICPAAPGAPSERLVLLPPGLVRLGFYLDPAGTGDAPNAPQPERFFANRFFNDFGPDGSDLSPLRDDYDLQCLVYDISHLRGGELAWVLAWESCDAGGRITSEPSPDGTDNDYADLVVEVRAAPMVATRVTSVGRVKSAFEH